MEHCGSPEQIHRAAGRIPIDGITLQAEFCVPAAAKGLVLFAHGSGSGRRSPRNGFVAWILQRAGLGTVLFDLLTQDEELADTAGSNRRFDIGLLARRLTAATVWSAAHPLGAGLDIGYFGSSTGAAAALVAASRLGHAVGAIVSRGGRPDLADEILPRVVTPTLLVVGGRDETVLELNRSALNRLSCEKRLEMIPNATHLFEEPNALNGVAALAAGWFQTHLGATRSPALGATWPQGLLRRDLARLGQFDG